jgi:DNA mismatch repair protein MutS
MKTKIKDNKVESINENLPPVLKQYLQTKQKNKDTITPMMNQYIVAKDQYPDTIIFFRMGDFYEMFFDDAQNAGRALNLTVTSRNKDPKYDEPMSGFPQHQLGPYLSKALELGFKIAVCDQLEDADKARGLVDRGIIQVATPGVVIDEEGLQERSNQYLTAIYAEGDFFGMATLDLSASFLSATLAIGEDALKTEISRLDPKEILICDPELRETLKRRFPRMTYSLLTPTQFEVDPQKEIFTHIKSDLGLPVLAAIEQFGFVLEQPVQKALSSIFFYVLDTQKKIPNSLHHIKLYHAQDSMILDETAIQNLELFKTLISGKKTGSLIDLIDQTKTSMGGRKLKQWVTYPLMNLDQIKQRHTMVDWLKNNEIECAQISHLLKSCYDLERLNTKTAMGKSNPKDLVAMRNTLRQIPLIKSLIAQSSGVFDQIQQRLIELPAVLDLLERSLNDTPPTQPKDGGVIRDGYHAQLDQYNNLLKNQKDLIDQLLISEKQKTGITHLKIDFNQVFGYYIEVTKSNLSAVPKHYIRKQTLANAERYVTEELKVLEEQMFEAQNALQRLEVELFNEIRDFVSGHSVDIAQISDQIAILDVLVNFAQIAQEKHYCRPEMTDECVIDIKQGRHPVVEQIIGREKFIANDFHIHRDVQRLLLITGPNMAGKSTMMRQVALIVLLAQIGSFVPAQFAKLGLVDRIFTRVGASDDLSSGKSTFMVEMSECAVILKEATPKSLVILDEIGRGTSTFDGMSIAWAVVESLHDQIEARTLFATHYHELTELEQMRRHIGNYTVAIQQDRDDIIFLHQMIKGAANKSYGIQVAKLAGLPLGVIKRAEEILRILEEKARQEEKSGVYLKDNLKDHLKDNLKDHLKEKDNLSDTRDGKKKKVDQMQLSLFSPPAITERYSEVEKTLKSLDIDQFTPMQALNLLHTLVKKVK